MSLKKKIMGILLALMTLAAIMDFAVHRWVIYPNYAALERAPAKKDLARCVAALEDEIEHLDTFANDWSAWNDNCRFVARPPGMYRIQSRPPHISEQPIQSHRILHLPGLTGLGPHL
jgi:sensor domain CHASE-containing protein